jgi:riboflavin kinase/FMN adenylyltransferase
MQVFRRLPPREQRRPCALTIGTFDGVHRGHQALLATLHAEARARGLDACVLTFEPHPREFFAARRGLAAPPRISTLRDKLNALAEAGIDRACVLHFSERWAQLSAASFIAEILVQGLRAQYILIGDDFRFGAGRQGDFALLQRAAATAGFECAHMATVCHDQHRVSSTAVRAALAAADFAQVHALLGRTYAISGHVVHGRKLGRTLGFPTLNLRIPYKSLALAGVFVVNVHGLGPDPTPAVASLGTRPAIDNQGILGLEVHILDWHGDAYGQRVRVEFLHKLRQEAHYPNLDALRAQIARDVDQARSYFLAHAHAQAQPGASAASTTAS